MITITITIKITYQYIKVLMYETIVCYTVCNAIREHYIISIYIDKGIVLEIEKRGYFDGK